MQFYHTQLTLLQSDLWLWKACNNRFLVCRLFWEVPGKYPRRLSSAKTCMKVRM